jgi:hypothetical protein
MMRPNEVIPARVEAAPASLAELARQINQEHEGCEQSLRAGLQHALNAGKLLLEAKRKVGHGGWGDWLKANVTFSDRTARGYMKVAREVPTLEESKRQRVAVLPLRDALKELARVPAAEAAVSLSEAGAENLDMLQSLSEMGYPPDPSLVPKAGHCLWFITPGRHLWIEPSDDPSYFYVTLHHFSEDEDKDFSRSTRSPVLAEAIPCYVEHFGAREVVTLAIHRVELEREGLDYNHWLYSSREEWERRELADLRD